MISSVLVTGSNRGIGLELIKKFLSRSQPPEKIFATCRNPEGARSEELRNLASKHSNIVLLPLDATNAESVKEAVVEVEKYLNGSGLNLLINNAGVMPRTSLDQVDGDEMIDTFNTNVVGSLQVSQAFYPLLKKSAEKNAEKPLGCEKAALVNVSSVLGSIQQTPLTFQPEKQVISYRISKAALNMLTRLQAEAYKKDGILCTALHPGWVRTEMGTERALLTTHESVTGIMEVLSSLSEKQNGILVTWDGKVIPW
ncbi:C-signal-like [Anomaloglossus baeobatrachus]|uniref:C-signal-like n=1 Tax=Anomaloglossus baeobatrachus TaxID=238106 RepID=UPI003F500961